MNERKDYIFCNDPVCEADRAVKELETKINELKKDIILRDLMIRQQNVIIENVAIAIKETKYFKGI